MQKKEEFVLTEKDRGWALGLRDMMSTSFLQEYLSYFFYEAYLERHAKAYRAFYIDWKTKYGSCCATMSSTEL